MNKFKYKRALSACLLLSLMAPIVSATQFKQQKLIAKDGAAEDSFGYSVAVSHNTALVGSHKSDDETVGADTGSAYVFIREDNAWKPQTKLTANDPKALDTFGGNVALFADTAVVGAIGHDSKGEKSGAAYVFSRKDSNWHQQTKLMASDGAKGDAFGQSIAVSMDSIVIGAPHDDDKGEGSGSVYIFTRNGKTWNQQTKLTASDGMAGDLFGISVAISEDTILIGADLNDEKATNAGAVYVFTRTADGWSQQAKLMAQDGGKVDIFGVRVALSGDTALISARRDDDEVMGVDAGSAYVFIRVGSKWQQQAKLTAPDGAADDRFGRGVALSGDTAVISAMHQDDMGENSGSAYVYTRKNKRWSHQANLSAEDGAAGDLFGWNVALFEDTLLVGAINDDDSGKESGSVYVFDINND